MNEKDKEIIEQLQALKQNPTSILEFTIAPKPEVMLMYRAPRHQARVFEGCEVKLLARIWRESDQNKQFVMNMTHGPAGEVFRITVLRMDIKKPGNPVEVQYHRIDNKSEEMPPQVLMLGIFDATYTQAREMLKHAKEIKPYSPLGKKITQTYKPYIERWKAGERYNDLLDEWEEENPGFGRNNFYRAFWRAGYRKRKDKNTV
jgi:hypothetical protein